MRVKLEDVCERGSSNLRQSDVEGKTGNYPIYGAAGYIGNVDFFHQSKPYVAVVKDGAGIGRTMLLPAESSVIGTMQYLLPKDNVLPEYLCYVVRYMHLEKYFSGATIPHIYFRDYKNEEFHLDSLDRQTEIVDVLKRSEKIIEYRKYELTTLDELIKARFVEMFGVFDLTLQKVEWTPISQIGTVVGGSTPKTGVDEYWDGEYRWISPAELEADSGIIYDSLKKITKAGIESCSLQELPVGTVILSSRAPIGKVAIAGNTFYCNQGFKNIICNDKVLPRYLYTLFLFNTEYLNSLGRGATFKEISKSIVENIRIPLPSIDMQKQFEVFVSQIDKSKAVVQKALDEAQLLFDSLMQQYFG